MSGQGDGRLLLPESLENVFLLPRRKSWSQTVLALRALSSSSIQCHQNSSSCKGTGPKREVRGGPGGAGGITKPGNTMTKLFPRNPPDSAKSISTGGYLTSNQSPTLPTPCLIKRARGCNIELDLHHLGVRYLYDRLLYTANGNWFSIYGKDLKFPF